MTASPDHQRNPPEPSLKIGPVTLASRYALAPLAGYTNLAFRMAVRGCGGVGTATTDLVNARALLRGSVKTMELLSTVPDDRPVAVQIYGQDVGELRAAAQWLEGYGVSFVDINMGCPVHKVTRGGGGSALLCSPDSTIRLVAGVVRAVRIPVTVKMRLGWDAQTLSAPFFARAFEDVGVAAVTIHGRTRAQGFRGDVDPVGIRAVVDAVRTIPVFGNGDVRTVAEAIAMFEQTGCAGIAIGRGALLNPWIFSQLDHYDRTGERRPAATNGEHLDFMFKHFTSLVDLKGDRFGCLSFRKMASWYSKAIPMGRTFQARLATVGTVNEFHQIVVELRVELGSRLDEPSRVEGLAIKVPAGPNERW